MKTLVFCTAYARTRRFWRLRHERWLRALQASKLKFDQILIVDDGSPVLPDWPAAKLVQGSGELPAAQPSEQVVLYHFPNRLGRHDVYDLPGWYRSFALAAAFAKQYNFEKVIHIESDAYLISDRIHNYFNFIQSGWIALWCEKYDFPEIAFQLICGSHLQKFYGLTRQDYSKIVGRVHEYIFPLTYVEKAFIGDRYGESSGHIPFQADYVAQTQISREPEYYWWIDPRITASIIGRPEIINLGDPKKIRQSSKFLLSFDKNGGSDNFVLDGWSHQEDQIRWMTNEYSKIVMPGIQDFHGGFLSLDMFPHLDKGLNALNLQILLNDNVIFDDGIDAAGTIPIEIPRKLINSEQPNVIEFFHPNAKSPFEIHGSGDMRKLALCVSRLELVSRFTETQAT